MFDKAKIINYIEDKHLPDGGYCFYKVEPSGGFDTYLAVKTLHLLDTFPRNKNSIIQFWQQEKDADNVNDVIGLFFATQTYKELGEPIDVFDYAKDILIEKLQINNLLQKKKFTLTNSGKFGLYEKSTNVLFTEVVEKELEMLYRFITLFISFSITFDKKAVEQFVHSLQNNDGGFGSLHGSQLSTTYYALMVLNLLDKKPPKNTQAYLEKAMTKVNYLEDIFYLVQSLHLLNHVLPEKEYLKSFLSDCYRDGGFSRSRNLGVATIEYTYFATSILKTAKLYT